MKKLLYLSFNDDKKKNRQLDLLRRYEGVNSDCVFYSVCFPLRCLRRLHFLISHRKIDIWFREWKKKINDYDYVVCIASRYSPFVLQWIKEVNDHAKLINFYIDQFDVSGYPYVVDKGYENWTFNYQDSMRYGMKFNPQYFSRLNTLPISDIKYLVSYVGADRGGRLKDRTKIVDELYNYCETMKITNYFYYVTNSNNVNAKIKKSRYMTEEEFYIISSSSKVIIEIVEETKQWVTARTFLALANRKKLITNNRTIIHERFYNKDDVFVLGIDGLEHLKSFIESSFVSIAEEDLQYYEFKSWLKRIIEDE